MRAEAAGGRETGGADVGRRYTRWMRLTHEENRTPTERDAVEVVRRVLGVEARAIVRFPTGLAHYVYDVELEDDRRVVARLARVGEGGAFAAGAQWSERLRPRGVPLPQLLAVETQPPAGTFPFMLLERLPGRDLIYEYPALSSAQKRALARRIVAIQRAVGNLPLGRGFGFAASHDDPSLHGAWIDVLHEGLRRSRERIQEVGAVSTDRVDRTEVRIAPHRSILSTVRPVCFLDDTTTKNVLIHEGRLSGIVDVDAVCFGDPLFTPALTWMSLLSAGHDTDYISYWADELGLDDQRRALLALYTAVHGVTFLSERGQRFNKDTAPAVDPAEVARLETVLDGLLAQT